PTKAPEWNKEWEEAEEQLLHLERQRRQLETAEGGGILLGQETRTRAGGTILGPETTGIDARVSLRMAQVPTGILHLLDARQNPLVSFQLAYSRHGKKDHARLRVTSYVEGYSARAVNTMELKVGEDPVEIDQLPTFFPDQLAKVTELTRATLHIEIDDLDAKVE